MAEGEGNDGTGGTSSSARPLARKNCDFFDLVDMLDNGGEGCAVGRSDSSICPLAYRNTGDLVVDGIDRRSGRESGEFERGTSLA